MEENEIADSIPIEKFKERHEYLSEECVRLRSTIEDLGLLNVASEYLQKLSTKHNMKDAKTDWKAEGCLAKLKTSLRTYQNLNEELCEDINIAKREVARSQQLLKEHSIPEDEIKILKEKIQRYETQWKKLDQKYSWLQDPQFNTEYITKQIAILKGLKSERNKLEDDINKYCGLKPDLVEAKEQLATVKNEYEALMKHVSKIAKY